MLLRRCYSVSRTVVARRRSAIVWRVRSAAGSDPNLFGPEPADEEPDRFGHYRYDISPERYQRMIRGFNSAFYSVRPVLNATALKNLMIDKYGRIYPIQLCLGDHQQVYLHIEPRPLDRDDPHDALDPLLSMTAATLTEWGVSGNAWKEIAKHPAKRMPPHGVYLPLPVYFYDAPAASPPE